MKERGGETEVNVNCSAFVSFFFFVSCSGSDQGEKETGTCRKKLK